MKFEFFFIGKTAESYLAEGIDRYRKKLVFYMNSEIKIIPISTEKNITKALKIEAEKIFKLISPSDLVIVLDENGSQFSSIGLSKELQNAMNRSYLKIIFVVGSAYGIDESLKNRANMILSFSKFTLTHQMIRLLLLEQVYRAMTILKGESYHHE